MIRLILGNIGSGKSLSAVKKIIESRTPVYTNINIRLKSDKIIRLRHDHIITDDLEIKNGKEREIKRVNWDYWTAAVKELDGFHIVIDELQNIMSSRAAMSKNNILMAQWIAQIRKVTGSNENADLICISQELMRVDLTVRELAHEIIYCQKIEKLPKIPTVVWERGKKKTIQLPKTWILATYFTGEACLMRYAQWRNTSQKCYNKRKYFFANPYMQYYNSYEIVNFGESEYL